MGKHVLLFPGFGETSFKMSALSYWLQLAGYETEIIDYPSTMGTAEELIADYFVPAMKKRAEKPVIHCVTNSIGGILLRGFLASHEQPNLGRVVMIGPGHKGSHVLEIVRHHPLAKLLLGPLINQAGDDKDAYACQLPSYVDFDLGIIAGGISLDPVAYCISPQMQDGRVTVESSKIDGMKDHVVLPIPHEMLAHHPLTSVQVIHFLQRGYFNHIPGFCISYSRQAA